MTSIFVGEDIGSFWFRFFSDVQGKSLHSSGLRRLLERDGFASLPEACPVIVVLHS